MVDPVTPISATAPSSPTRIGTSTSIGSEPDNAWVAARQAQITADALTHVHPQLPHPEAEIPGLSHRDPSDDRDQDRRHRAEEEPDTSSLAERSETGTPQDDRLSGESERIGTVNFDDDTPFGTRKAII